MMTSLRVLSLARIHVDPEAIERMSLFQNLEHLDLTDCFSVNHYNDFEEEYESPLPYDDAMVSCIEALPKLKRLDIGNKDQEMQRYMHDYSLSRDCLSVLCSLMEDEKDHVGIINRDESNEPQKFTTTVWAEASRADALLTLWKRDDLPIGVRNLAQNMLKIYRPGCKNDAAKRCSKCNGKWYCRQECQQKHFKRHKHTCNQNFEDGNQMQYETICYSILAVNILWKKDYNLKRNCDTSN